MKKLIPLKQKKGRSFTFGDFIPAIIFLIICFVGAFFFDNESVWDRRLKSGYSIITAMDDLGSSEWSHTDNNGSEVVLWEIEGSETSSGYWIVIGFNSNSIMYSYDIVYSQDEADRVIKGKY
ncbi:MAG: hypothetical protein ACJZ8W_09280 [Limisphaerales bacterium]